MIHNPESRGRALAAFYLELGARLYADLEESGLLATDTPTTASRAATGPDAAGTHARREWECFSLYACVRGLVAAGGFNRETAAAIDAFHAAVLDHWMDDPAAGESIELRRTRISERYSEYGAIGQAGGASGAASVTLRLGAAAARHLAAPLEPSEGLAELAGGLHEALVEGATEAVRIAEPS
ncbi:MAG: hypothetical protein HYR73_00975 [Candidatus Eisenbacteria bacterium]|nr:hypothetical protein [Candidatus Eisenbacteria bacterium]